MYEYETVVTGVSVTSQAGSSASGDGRDETSLTPTIHSAAFIILFSLYFILFFYTLLRYEINMPPLLNHHVMWTS